MTAKKSTAAPPRQTGQVDIDAGLDKLLKLNEKNAKNGSTMFRASDWNPRYIDFIDLKTGTPNLPFEYLFGCRGVICGRVFCVVAEEAKGKSTWLSMLYGMGQRTGGIWGDHVETELTQTPPDFMASVGCDPTKLLISRHKSVTAGLEHITGFIAQVRKDIDPGKKLPIMQGIDSVSGLAGEIIDESTGEVSGGAGLAPHSREVSEFFRNSLNFIEKMDGFLMFTGQKKAKVEKDGFGGGGGKKTTFIAEGTIKFHASWTVNLNSHKLEEDEKDVGNRIFATTEKNKLAPKDRMIEIHLYRDGRGIDMTKGNINLLFSNTSPFDAGSFGESGNGYYWQADVNGGKKMRARDFVAEFYGNKALVEKCREKLRIRGFGFDFEKNYKPLPPTADEPVPDEEIEEFPNGSGNPGEAAGKA